MWVRSRAREGERENSGMLQIAGQASHPNIETIIYTQSAFLSALFGPAFVMFLN